MTIWTEFTNESVHLKDPLELKTGIQQNLLNGHSHQGLRKNRKMDTAEICFLIFYSTAYFIPIYYNN
jgi:hypothetical protein